MLARLSIALGIAVVLHAQIGGTGSIQGTLTDPSGAAIPGATVTATNTAANVKTFSMESF
jgi:hypothetical protein